MEGTILMDLQELKFLPASGGLSQMGGLKLSTIFWGAKDKVCESFFSLVTWNQKYIDLYSELHSKATLKRYEICMLYLNIIEKKGCSSLSSFFLLSTEYNEIV